MSALENLRRATQVDAGRPYREDRLSEIASFLRLSEEDTLRLYNETNVEMTKKAPTWLFTKHDHPSIVESYLEETFLTQSLTRLMLKYDRFEYALSCLNFMKTKNPTGLLGLRFLEYGAGAADYALAFSTQGVSPIVLDFEGGPVEFAAHRFKLRNIPVEVIKVTAQDQYPDLLTCDIVNATEVLEHVADPTRVVFNIWNALRPGGYFMFSDFPVRKKTVGGSHLPQADANREKCAGLLHLLFTPVYYDDTLKHVYIFQKRDR